MTWQHDSGDGQPHPKQRRVFPPSQPVNMTTLEPSAAQQQLALLLVSRGAIITAQSSSGVTGHFVTDKGPSIMLGLLLLLLCLVPGVLYLLLAKNTVYESFSITLRPTTNGTALARSGQGKGLASATWACAQLPGVTLTY